MNKIIKSLNTVCNFKPLKDLRDLNKDKHSYKIISETTTNLTNINASKDSTLAESNTDKKPDKKKKDPYNGYDR